MKIKSREVEELSSRGVVKPNREGKLYDGDSLSPFDFQLSTLNSRVLDLNSKEQSENVYENKRQ